METRIDSETGTGEGEICIILLYRWASDAFAFGGKGVLLLCVVRKKCLDPFVEIPSQTEIATIALDFLFSRARHL